MRTHLRAAAVTFLVALVPIVGCTPDPGSGGGGGSSGFTVCPSPAPGQVRVAVVVDATAFAAVSTPSVVCVVVAQNASGVAALNARAARIGLPAPRFDSSGLLCAIDGAPVAPACGDLGPDGSQYWSYWIGGPSWSYSPVGPAARQMQDGTVEGWRFTVSGPNVAPNSPFAFAQLVTP